MPLSLSLPSHSYRASSIRMVFSALDMFGGDLPYADVLSWHNSMQQR